MTGAENLMNTVINTLSMIDHGFTVTLTVQPHDWDCDGDDYEEEDDDEDDESRVSDEAIERIKEFSRAITESIRDVYNHILRGTGDDFGDMPKSDAAQWPSVGDEVWYKTKHGNHEHGKVKVVCHNTIQLNNNVTLERKDCKRSPFMIGDEVYFDWCGRIKHGVIAESSYDNVKVRCGNNTYCSRFGKLFDSVDELLNYLKSTVDE